MCLGGETPEAKPHELLAQVLKDELNVSVDPNALRLLLLHRWDRIAVLAHAIHDRGK